ncbi:hypothetical protein ABT381_34825 [Streptomyces sp. NPDC000151]|uniref:hypothetical protein n=1 Tax=Streptomyces sp. NPDC000151 TaxID=3154244 RepID=UPI003327556B
MPAVLALPAAVRLPRTVAVRRALLSGLFLIGFVVLAVAFGGGTAHAADTTQMAETRTEAQGAFSDDSTGTAGSTGSTGTSGSATTRDTSATSAASAPTTTDERSPLAGSGAALQREAADRQARAKEAGARLSAGAQASGERLGEAVRPLTDRLRPVTDPVTAPVHEVVQGVGHATGLPVRLPGDGVGQGRGGEQPQFGDVRDSGRQHVAVAERCGDRTGGDRSTAPVDTTGGPDRTAARAAADGAGDAPGQGGLPGHLPQGPVAPAPHTTGDGNGPRGGDQHAVLPGGHPGFGLVPGGVRAASGAPTREFSADILEFPG